MTTDNRTNEPTEAQVEAAAKAIADCHNPGMFEKYPENWRIEARAALEAAGRLQAPGGQHVGIPDRFTEAQVEAAAIAFEEHLPLTSGVLAGTGTYWCAECRKNIGPIDTARRHALSAALEAAAWAAQGAAPQAESEELAWYKRAAKHSADSMAEARATLQQLADRVDPFVFDELSSVLDDQPLDYETGWVIGEAAPVLPSSTAPQAESEYVYCPIHGDLLAARRSFVCEHAKKGHEYGTPALPSSGVDKDKLAEVLLKHSPSATDSGGFAACRCDRTWRSREGNAAHVARAVAEWLKGQGRGSEM